jgi:hypothetical protein
MDVAGGSQVLLAPEAERMVEELKAIDIKEIGSSAWLDQHEALQKLNMQAHQSVLHKADEFVKQALVDMDRMIVVVHELLSIEVWSGKVRPLLNKTLSKSNNSVKAYFLSYHEPTLCNLLEVLLFHRESVEALGDMAVEIVEYCHRKLLILHDCDPTDPYEGKSNEDILNMSEAEQQEYQQRELQFGVCISALTILRYLMEHVTAAPISVATKAIVDLDVLSLLIPLLEKQPWRRVSSKTFKVQKYFDGKWREVEDQIMLTKTEAQLWLCLSSILLEPTTSSKLRYDEATKSLLLKIRPYMCETLNDQLPIVVELQRFLDNLVMATPPAQADTFLMIETISRVRETLMENRDWPSIAAYQKQNFFSTSAGDREDQMKRLAKLFDPDLLDQVSMHGHQGLLLP